MSDSKSPGQVLEDYFSDMLGTIEVPEEGGPAAEQSPEGRAVQQESSQPQAQPAFAPPAEDNPDLERKQKLERLLASARAKVDIAIEPAVEIVAEVQPQVEVQTELPQVEVIEETSVVTTVEPAAQEGAIEFLEWCDNGRPQWAQERFDVLLFQVSGLTLAVPLIALGQIQPLTDELTSLFGQADWFMGLQPSPSGEIRTVNTALFVMPERYNPDFLKSAKYVVSLNGVPWGLAVDSVNQPISLQAEDVKWRSERSKRPWLAGTVKGHMCALIDIPQMAQMLLDADSGSRKR